MCGNSLLELSYKSNMDIDEKRFEVARDKIVGKDRQRLLIGTLSEKTVHAVVKNYYEPDEDKQEIPIEGLYADIFTGNEIIEIQTRNFDRLRDKLNRFLPLYPVTVVLPIPDTKWLIWIDEITGELSDKRKSPKKGDAYQVFRELYKIKSYLKEKNLSVTLLFLDIEEYRLLNGWSKDKKKGSSRYDRIPMQIKKEINLTCPEDYMQLLPIDIPEFFSVKDFSKYVKISQNQARVVLNILFYLNIVHRVDKKGNAYIYKINDLY